MLDHFGVSTQFDWHMDPKPRLSVGVSKIDAWIKRRMRGRKNHGNAIGYEASCAKTVMIRG
jgi:hypothetical protein